MDRRPLATYLNGFNTGRKVGFALAMKRVEEKKPKTPKKPTVVLPEPPAPTPVIPPAPAPAPIQVFEQPAIPDDHRPIDFDSVKSREGILSAIRHLKEMNPDDWNALPSEERAKQSVIANAIQEAGETQTNKIWRLAPKETEAFVAQPFIHWTYEKTLNRLPDKLRKEYEAERKAKIRRNAERARRELEKMREQMGKYAMFFG